MELLVSAAPRVVVDTSSILNLSDADRRVPEAEDAPRLQLLDVYDTQDGQEAADIQQIVEDSCSDIRSFPRKWWGNYQHPSLERQFLRFVAPHRWSTSVGLFAWTIAGFFLLQVYLGREGAEFSVTVLGVLLVLSIATLVVNVVANLCAGWSKLRYAYFAEFSLWGMAFLSTTGTIIDAYPGIESCAHTEPWNDCGSGVKGNYICIPMLWLSLVGMRLPLSLSLIWISPLVFVGRFVEPDPSEVLTGKIVVNVFTCALATIMVVLRDNENRERFEMWVSLQRYRVDILKRQHATSATLSLIIGDASVQALLTKGVAIRDSSECCTVVVCTIHDFHSWMMTFVSATAAEVCDVYHATVDRQRSSSACN